MSQPQDDALRHLDAIADTGTSHILHPRQYVVKCEWCPAVFFANTKRQAMADFREHESERIQTANAMLKGGAP